MRAVVFESYGAPDEVRLAELPVAEPGHGQLRVRVAAAAVNPVDLATRAGVLAGILSAAARPPHVLGWDVAGVVDAVGPGVVGFSPGDRVVAMSEWFPDGVGTQAEQVVLAARLLARAPTSVSAEAASTLPLNGLTAVQALDRADLRVGATLLVSGAAGGLGGYLVQLGASRGLRVLGLVASADDELVQRLGAWATVPRGVEAVAATRAVVPEGVDGAVDAAGIGPSLIGAVRDGGAFVAVTDPGLPAAERGIRSSAVHVHGDEAQLADLVRRVDDGALTLRVADVLGFDQAADAHRRLAKGGLRGRLVLTP